MGGGPESRWVGRVCGLDVAMQRTAGIMKCLLRFDNTKHNGHQMYQNH